MVGIFAPRGRLVSESGLAGAGRDTCGRGAVPELELFVGWVGARFASQCGCRVPGLTNSTVT